MVVSGPGVMQGYLSGDQHENGVIDSQGRLHTGDLGWFDSDGYLHLVGRKSEMIKTAGERVFPREIEDCIQLHPGVKESAVVGLPDPVLGEQIVAAVVAKPGARLDEANLKRHCLRHLPFVRAPSEIRILDRLERTASGKPDRRALVRTLSFPEEVGLR